MIIKSYKVIEMIEILKLIGNDNRLRVLNILYRNGKTCVCVLEESLSLNQSNLSRHLNKMKKAGIITSEKRAQWVDYSLSKKFLEDNNYLKEILERLEDKIFKEDLKKVKCTSC